ncbi:helix-turn-helix domain-containing protein [Kitasatospora sp. NPDC006697]|uniref:helix-turn-helix domain-containing protein n=1 Tax=Kitasatospora sp. NPDC006697 TaxID=3364020 RepID=UPI00369593EB
MLSARSVAVRPEFEISAVACRSDHTRWSPPEVRGGHRVVLVRRGRFRRRCAGVTAELDASLAYLGVPGEEESFAHPCGGDLCTSISVAPELWRTLAGERTEAGAVYVDPALDLAHRRVLAAAGSGDADYALAEELLALLATAIARTATGPTPGAAATRDRALVAAAREAIAADHPAAGTLLSLAELLGASPYRLSRAFPRELGVTVTHYRHRVRIGRALDRIEAGEPDLGGLAADLGYADQAHFTRTLRRHTGQTPNALRRLLGPGR